MATVTICDVKTCGDIIKDSKEVKNTTIAGRTYQLCKKCNDGLFKFLDENLNVPDNKLSPIQKVAEQDMLKLLEEMKSSSSLHGNHYWGSPFYVPSPYPSTGAGGFSGITFSNNPTAWITTTNTSIEDVASNNNDTKK